jgi:hypothetical protein
MDTCYKPQQPTTTSIHPAFSDNVTSIFQFRAQYQLSEVTEDVRSKMLFAVANTLGVETSSVILRFVLLQDRGQRSLLQQTGVLVSVGLVNFYGSVSLLLSRLTQENLNLKMQAVGLKSVQLIIITTSTIAASDIPGMRM